MIDLVHRTIVPAALALLPLEMTSLPARAMLLAIGLQESGFTDRFQVLEHGGRGPARGFWQFERGGAVAGVLSHPGSRPHAVRVLAELRYSSALADVHAALEHNDILAAALARLLLWTLPGELPTRTAPVSGWRQYLAAWRPGEPRPADWPKNFAMAWEIVGR